MLHVFEKKSTAIRGGQHQKDPGASLCRGLESAHVLEITG
jgi:hypothetical protein